MTLRKKRRRSFLARVEIEGMRICAARVVPAGITIGTWSARWTSPPEHLLLTRTPPTPPRSVSHVARAGPLDGRGRNRQRGPRCSHLNPTVPRANANSFSKRQRAVSMTRDALSDDGRHGHPAQSRYVVDRQACHMADRWRHARKGCALE